LRVSSRESIRGERGGRVALSWPRVWAERGRRGQSRRRLMMKTRRAGPGPAWVPGLIAAAPPLGAPDPPGRPRFFNRAALKGIAGPKKAAVPEEKLIQNPLALNDKPSDEGESFRVMPGRDN
jgi:hypothetical protein